MNALYGTFVERHEDVDTHLVTSGILFNSVWGSVITAKIRHKLLSDIKKKDYKHIVGFHTDSILTTKPLDLPLSDKMGDWHLETEKDVSGVVLKSGIYQIGDVVKRRGFVAIKNFDWFDLLKKNLNESYIETSYTKVMKIAESLRRFHNVDQVNTFIESIRKLYINGDRKRNWDRNFRNCKDVLENNISSKPLEHYCLESKFDYLI